MQFGASSEPSYTMKIEALARDVQSAMNKRNIALLQTHMKQALDIPSSRGYMRFVPVTEECTGRKGNTVAGEVAVAMQQAQPGTERRGSIRTPRRRSSKVGSGKGLKLSGLNTNIIECRHFKQQRKLHPRHIMIHRQADQLVTQGVVTILSETR